MPPPHSCRSTLVAEVSRPRTPGLVPHRSVRLASLSDSQVVGIHRVVAGLLVDADKVFLCHRSAGRRWYPNVWDLPGGHIEQTETPAEALVRELHEELGILIPQPADPAFAHLRRPDFDCRIWVVRKWTGNPHIAVRRTRRHGLVVSECDRRLAPGSRELSAIAQTSSGEGRGIGVPQYIAGEERSWPVRPDRQGPRVTEGGPGNNSLGTVVA